MMIPRQKSTFLVMQAVATELERLASYDIDPTDHLPDWLLEALPQPDGSAWLAAAAERWAPIVAALRGEAVSCVETSDN